MSTIAEQCAQLADATEQARKDHYWSSPDPYVLLAIAVVVVVVAAVLVIRDLR